LITVSGRAARETVGKVDATRRTNAGKPFMMPSDMRVGSRQACQFHKIKKGTKCTFKHKPLCHKVHSGRR